MDLEALSEQLVMTHLQDHHLAVADLFSLAIHKQLPFQDALSIRIFSGKVTRLSQSLEAAEQLVKI